MQFYAVAGLTNSINSSRKLKVMWLIILGRTTHVHRFNYSHQFWHRKPLARWKVRIESDARSTMCPGQNDIHFLFTVGHWVVTGGYVFISVSSFVCLLVAGLCRNYFTDFHKKKSLERQHMDQWRNDKILLVIRIWIRIQECSEWIMPLRYWQW